MGLRAKKHSRSETPNAPGASGRGLVLPALLVWIAISGVASAATPGATPTSPTKKVSEPTTVCASLIVVRYWGAVGAEEVRSSATSLLIARDALARVSKPGADFDAIGREFAEKYRDVDAGRTGPISRGKLAKPLEDVIFALRPGQTADRITTTNEGFHIFRRNRTVRCRHIMIAYKGTSRAIVDRTKEQAQALAEKIRVEALAPGGADFAALARRYSDAPDGAGGGDVGVFDRNMMIKPFEKAAFALKVGEISTIVQTRFGLHIIQRIE